MTNFKHYIIAENEIKDRYLVNKAAEYIKRDSKKFLKEIQGYDTVYRGFIDSSGANVPAGNKQSILKIHNVRKDRKPRFIGYDLHEFMSDYSKKNFGWDTRKEGVFTGSKKTAKMFTQGSRARAIFPIGDYKYVCMTKDLIKLYSIYDRLSFGYRPSFKEQKPELIKLLKQYKVNKGLSNVVQNQGASWECIIKTDKYYSVPMEYADQVLEAAY